MNDFLINGNIDWGELRKQKKDLLAVIGRQTDKGASDTEKAEAESLTGILHLIDNVQDNAVESGIWTEQEIFGGKK